MSAQLAAHGRLGGGGGGVMEYHPVASLFPLMEGDEFHALVDDIKRNGLIVPITLSDGLILDGRNRYRACQEAGVEPHYQEVSGDLNPWSHVWSINATRRHLDPGTHSCCYYEYRRKSSEWLASREQAQAEANRKRSEATKAQPRTEDGLWRPMGVLSDDKTPDIIRDWRHEKLAKESGTSPATMGRAIALTDNHPDLAARVRSGELKLIEASRQARRERMAEKVAELPDGKYRVIYADPPWKYGDTLVEGYGPANRHYEAMTISELEALDVRSIAAEDSVLFLWVTAPLFMSCGSIVQAWGFEYKTMFVWDKVRHNFGHYSSVRHELLLVCTRGSCLPDSPKLHDSVVSLERSKTHSEKPEYFRNLIEEMYTEGRKVELFARRRVDGWDAHGNEL